MLSGATLIGSPLFAFAAEAEGLIETIDWENRAIKLEDGSVWEVEDGIDLSSLANGDPIYLMFEDGTSRLISITKTS
ncbi:MAG: hypothetical protein AAFR27_11730 [Pseudomonadota bacterium]